MIEVRSFSYPSEDGVHTIQARAWLPQGEPRGVVQIVHGVAEHIGRYDHVGRFLAEHGFVVYGEDHLGHGLTVDDGKYGYFGPKGGWWLVVKDIRRLRELAGAEHPGLPYVMLGHSMGSFLTRTYLIRYPGTLDGAVLSGTGQQSAPLVALGRLMARGLCRAAGPEYVSRLIYYMSLGSYNRRFRGDPASPSWLSRDWEMVRGSRKDPLCSFRPSAGMFRDMLEGIQFIGKPANLAGMDKDTPIYFFSGDQDPVGDQGKGVKNVVSLFRQAGCRDVTVKLYPGGRHEMLNEVNRREVMEDLLSWLEEKVVPKTGKDTG